MDISAIESGTFKLHLSLVKLPLVVERSIALNKINAEKKKINITSEYINVNEEVYADETMIEQVLNNLISNAVKYSNNNTEVNVKTIIDLENFIISVTDKGVGINENEIQDIFKIFYKSEKKNVNREKSSGLGLAIVKKIVDLHKGKISVKSKVGEGTTIYISIPKKGVIENE